MASKRGHPESWRLYVILDKGLESDGKRLLRVARSVIAAGASAIQLRDKSGGGSSSIGFTKRIREECALSGIPFIVNDKPEIALAVDADGLHIGQSDISARLARSLIGKERLLGISAGNMKEVLRARAAGADYIGVGPAFRTPLKKDKRPVSAEFLKRIARFKPPVILIGGIDLNNIRKTVEMGFIRVAVIRAVLKARDPYRQAKSLIKILES